MSDVIAKSMHAMAKCGSPKPLAYASITSNTTTALLSGVAGKSIRVHRIFISGTCTVAVGTLTFKDGTTTKLVRRCPVVTLGGLESCIDFASKPWELSVGADLNLTTAGATAMAYDITVSYEYSSPST